MVLINKESQIRSFKRENSLLGFGIRNKGVHLVLNFYHPVLEVLHTDILSLFFQCKKFQNIS